MFRKLLICCSVFQFLILAVAAQTPIQSRQYPQNFFRYPLDLPPTTAGSFGELRGMHFHSGLDFKTNQREGYPIHAVNDGFVSRLRVQFGGFGNAVYITHPNGYVSVYGHLQRFAPALEKALRAYQYQIQTSEVDLKLQPNQIPVCKDDIIAWSGNTGGSAGPHLHFELRDSATEETINPQLFGLTIPDHVPPTITAAAVYHLDGQPFSEKTKKEFLPVTGSAGHYRLARSQVLNLDGQVGFGIAAYDINSTSFNRNGIYSLELKVDGKTVYTFAAERFAFDQTHALNAYVDYPLLVASGRIIQKCFILPGSKISLYPQSVNRGLIAFDDSQLHDVKYKVKDVAGNESTLSLKVKAGSSSKSMATVTAGAILFHFDKRNEYANDKVKVIVEPGNLYDDLDFNFAVLPEKPGAFSATYRIHNRFTPVHESYQLWIRPDERIGNRTDKAVIVNTDGACAGGTYQDGYIKADARSFGDYYIKLDTTPPFIIPINIHNGSNLASPRRIQLKIGDSLSGIKSYSATIDGKWVLGYWDFKTRVMSYTFDQPADHGKHNFELTVIDNKTTVRNTQHPITDNMAELQEGDKAPAFTAKDQNGNEVSLSLYKGKNVILYFYPKDDTPGCTAEACSFRDNYQSLTGKGFEVIGVSTDDEKSHKKFETKYQLPFALIADADKKIVEAYGVWVEKSMYGKKYMGTARTTFIIDGDGLIKKIINKVDTKNSSQQVIDLLN